MKGILELEAAQEPQGRNLMIVDCLNLAFRYKQRGQTDFAADYIRTIISLAKSYNCGTVALLHERGSSKYRKHISGGLYKSNRKEKYDQQTDEEREKFEEFFEGFEKAIDLASNTYPDLSLAGVEADDMSSYIVTKCKHRFDNIWLISTDKDWDLLLDTNVHRFSYITRKEYTLENFYESHGCDTPEEYISMKVLMGDSGDGVDGIPGIGEKRAYNLIREYGSALDIHEALPLEGKQKFVQNLNNSADMIIMNYQLMDLLGFCSDAIAFPDKDNINKIDKFIEGLI